MKRIVINQIPHTLTIDDYELVFTPTKAIARSLQVAHYTLESIAETTVKKAGFRIASGLLTRRLLQQAIGEVLKVKDVTGITTLWTPVIQELLSSNCDLIALKEYPGKRVKKLANVALDYQQKLRQINCLDRSELFSQAADLINTQQSCLFYGYFTPDRSQLRFIDALAGHNSLLFLPCEAGTIFSSNQSHVSWLQNQGWQVAKVNLNSKTLNLGQKLKQYYSQQQELPSGIILHSYSNLEAEVRGVLTQVKLLLTQGVKVEEIVLVTRDEQLYGDTLLDIAWEYELPLNAFYDVSFLTTRLGAWLQLLLEIINTLNTATQLSFEGVSKLLAHPLVKQLDHETWQQARINYPQTIADWQEIGVDLSLLKLPKEAESCYWLEAFQQILVSFTVDQKVKPWAKEIVAYYQFQEALQELLLTTKPLLTQSEVIQEIQELLNSLTVPIQPGRGGVEIHSPLSIFGSKYRYVFVLGMAETIFPPTMTDDLVLSFSDRKKIAQDNFEINTIIKQIQKEELIFYFLLQVPTQQIIFSYAQLMGKQAYNSSPYLTSLKLSATSPEKLYLASIEEIRHTYLHQATEYITIDRLLPLINHKWQVEQTRASNLPNEYNGFPGISLNYQHFTFSASQLTQIGQCPFKWFASRILKLKEIEEAQLVLASNLRGSLYHQCLELCLAEVNTAADLARFNQQQLNQVLQTVETQLEVSNIPTWSQQKPELLKLLSLNLTSPEFLPLDSQVIEREKNFTTQWHDLKITGSIDRLDRTPQGITVIDYKSSSSTPLGIKDQSGKANLDLQLPLYIDVMAQEYPEETIDAVYYSLSKCKPIRRNKTNQEDLAQFAVTVKKYLTQGNYPIAPDTQYKACNYCKFDLVCRINRT